MISRTKIIVAITAVVVAVATMYFLVPQITGQHSAVGGYDDFAQCLSEKGVVMYGSSQCGWCKQQMELFGDSFKYIEYVDCSGMNSVCVAENIRSIPTWKIGDETVVGMQQLSKLSEISGCPLA